MSEILQLNDDEFQNQVIHSGDTVLVDFSATWCGPCKRLEPILETLSKEWTGKVRLVRLDVDASADLAMQYQVMSVPTLILFKGGQSVERMTGLQPRDKIVSKFEQYL